MSSSLASSLISRRPTIPLGGTAFLKICTVWGYGVNYHNMSNNFSPIDPFKSPLASNYLTPTLSKQEYDRKAF